MTQLESFKTILTLVENAKSTDRDLEYRIMLTLWAPSYVFPNIVTTSGKAPHNYEEAWNQHFWESDGSPVAIGRLTSSIDDITKLIRTIFPSWWVSSGLCSRSGHASMGPDYTYDSCDTKLIEEFSPDIFDVGVHADLAPGDGIHRQCLALCSILLQTLIAQGELKLRGKNGP